MQKVKQIIKGADKNQSSFSFTFSGTRSKGNIIGGVLGIAFWIVFIIFFIQKSVNVFGKKSVNVESFKDRNMKRFLLDSAKASLMFTAVYSDGTKFYRIKPSQANSYGFQIVLAKIYSDTRDVWYDTVNLVPFDATEGEFKIPDENATLQMTCTSQNVNCDKVVNYYIFVTACSPKQADCAAELTPNITIWVSMYDNKYDVFQPNTAKMSTKKARSFVFDDMKLSPLSTYYMDIFFSKIQIQTDESIAPSFLNAKDLVQINSWFVEQKTQYVTVRNMAQKLYFTITFQRSQFTERYKRNFTKLDSMLGQVLGFMGLITLVVTLFCSGYNSYLMDQYIKDKKTEIDEQIQRQNNQQSYVKEDKKKEKDVLDYIKHFFKNEEHKHTGQIDIFQIYKDVKIMKNYLFSEESKKSLRQSSQQNFGQKKQIQKSLLTNQN